MVFKIRRTSHRGIDYPGVREVGSEYEIDINSLEDLKKLEEYYDEHLIISMRYMTIEIYDSYRE